MNPLKTTLFTLALTATAASWAAGQEMMHLPGMPAGEHACARPCGEGRHGPMDKPGWREHREQRHAFREAVRSGALTPAEMEQLHAERMAIMEKTRTYRLQGELTEAQKTELQADRDKLKQHFNELVNNDVRRAPLPDKPAQDNSQNKRDK